MKIIFFSLLCFGIVLVSTVSTKLPISHLGEAVFQVANRVLDEAVKTPENVVFSPFSITAALTLLDFYPWNTTINAEIMKLLGNLRPFEMYSIQNDISEVFQNYGKITQEVSVANAFYIDEKFSFTHRYQDTMENFYHLGKGGLRQVDFSDGENVKEEINRFVAKATNNKIQELLKTPLDAKTVLALFNVVAFKANWLNQFPPRLNYHMFFENQNVTAMSGEMERVKFIDESDVQMIELPFAKNTSEEFKDPQFSMIIVVPRYETVSEYFRKYNLRELIETVINGNDAKVALTLPKFDIESKFDLKDFFKNDLITMFRPTEHFQGMVRNARSLKVDFFEHVAKINVFEAGTEAVAVTSLRLLNKILSKSEVMIVDRPFAYAIYDKHNEIVLFAGVVNKP